MPLKRATRKQNRRISHHGHYLLRYHCRYLFLTPYKWLIPSIPTPPSNPTPSFYSNLPGTFQKRLNPPPSSFRFPPSLFPPRRKGAMESVSGIQIKVSDIFRRSRKALAAIPLRPSREPSLCLRLVCLPGSVCYAYSGGDPLNFV